MNSLPRLAVLEDNQDLREELTFFLEARGYPVWGAASAESFWKILHAHPADIVLVDLGLPGEDGLSVLEYLRDLGRFGIIVITARGSQQDKLRGLDQGADLYLIKPVNFSQLAKDVDALWFRLRDTRLSHANGQDPAAPRPWRLDSLNATLTSPAGDSLHLTPQELALVGILARQTGQTFPKRQVHDEMFGTADEAADMHRVDVVLSRLRQKAAQHKMRLPIRTVFGRGLVFIDSSTR
ncbi:response regulator transcription factor [Achromobacter sp. GG226]|uniref:response regulator transcription factor n=1 Tax=Verticiella alkaliphila TaxID=2779529 RepID=UPI001C0E619E|nr:response regulator transcription factor [Verticiella sp. GG226]MBU4613059.1 response regulator transcription factor [Verticiella sp. GG226]